MRVSSKRSLDKLKKRFRSTRSGPVRPDQGTDQAQFFRSLRRTRRVPSLSQWRQLPRFLSAGERKIGVAALALGVISLIVLVLGVYSSNRQVTAIAGGSYTEGLIGSPQLINPIYANLNDVDQDIARLVYSGLMRFDPEEGLVTDLAESYTVSDDERVYTFALRDNATWHNGDPVTVRDILFTFQAIQDANYASPLNGTFRGISIDQLDERTVSFALEEPFAPFLSTMTVGILPASYWGDLDPTSMRLAERNLVPLGSGPYQFSEFAKERNGAIRSYTLTRYPRYYDEPAKIETIEFKFYSDILSAIDALENRRVEGIAFAPKELIDDIESLPGVAIYSPRLPQITGLFYNLESDTVADKNLRRALGSAIDKDALITEVLQGNAEVAHTPILPEFQTASEAYLNQTPFSPTTASALLDELGWARANDEEMRQKTSGEGDEATTETLTLKLHTVDQPETVAVAERIVEMWRDVGIDASVEAVDPALFRDDVLRDRSYDVLLSGTLMSGDPDPYPFWHSSQTTHPGLNLSQFSNRDADEEIETARTTNNIEERREAYETFVELFNDALPATILYQPTYTYVTANRIRGIQLDAIVIPADRFGQVNDWFIRTRRKLRFTSEGN